jgi:hypothetical protein
LSLNGARAAADALEGTDNVHGVSGLVDLAEDDVLAIEPAGLLSGDEELGAVAERKEEKR